MTPTRLYEYAKEGAKDIVDLDEIVDTYTRLGSGTIGMVLKNGKKAVFRIDGNSKKKFLTFEWR